MPIRIEANVQTVKDFFAAMGDSSQLNQFCLTDADVGQSPWTDLALSGESYQTRAEADPIFARDVLQAFADMYLVGQDSTNPKASPLYAPVNGLPPVRIDVGDNEVQAAGVEIPLSILGGHGACLPVLPWPVRCSRTIRQCHRRILPPAARNPRR